jgi:lipoate-protein ligase B
MAGMESIWSGRTGTSLEVYLLGVVDLDAALLLQERFLEELRQREDRQGVLLVCEHPPAVTVGREADPHWLADSKTDLRDRDVPVVWVNRGGGAVLHAPGQLAAYPVIPVERCGWGLVEFRQKVERGVTRACLDLHVPAWTEADETGVWTRGGQVAEIGLAVQSGISTHGVFLEVAPWRDWVSRSRQRLTARPRTSLMAQRSRPTPMGLVREALIRHLAAQLDYTRFHLYTSHAMLRRAQKVVAYA